MNILLVEPDYRSKFPPLGLMRISSFHKQRGDSVTFTRGMQTDLRDVKWHRIYFSSLFTYELPRTLKTIKYYEQSVSNPQCDIYVGGIGVTLCPDFIKNQIACNVIEGPLDHSNILHLHESPISEYIPDYNLIDSVKWKYKPDNSYFIRITKGCIRKCKFCAVPVLEPNFGYVQGVSEQIKEIESKYGSKANLVILDNNILALKSFENIINEIYENGFNKGAQFYKRGRFVDFNQGIDARLINKRNARLLSKICLSPVRLALDNDSVEEKYRQAVTLLAENGFNSFTTYIMYNFNDNPKSFYRRLKINLELSERLNIRISGFPMRYVPINDIKRHHISKEWNGRYLRGIQCILNATHGIVSPNPSFFDRAFGNNYKEFLEIISMPDQYIIYRMGNEERANQWRKDFRRLTSNELQDFYEKLDEFLITRRKKSIGYNANKYQRLLEHYNYKNN